MPVLEASGIRKRFGGVIALAGADFSLQAGEVHALVGSNGCGKSTLCKIIGGSVAADTGELTLNDKAVTFSGPQDAAAAGIGVFYQDLSLIPRMTVAENIYLGREPTGRGGLVDRPALREVASAALAGFRLRGTADLERNRQACLRAPSRAGASGLGGMFRQRVSQARLA